MANSQQLPGMAAIRSHHFGSRHATSRCKCCRFELTGLLERCFQMLSSESANNFCSFCAPIAFPSVPLLNHCWALKRRKTSPIHLYAFSTPRDGHRKHWPKWQWPKCWVKRMVGNLAMKQMTFSLCRPSPLSRQFTGHKGGGGVHETGGQRLPAGKPH